MLNRTITFSAATALFAMLALTGCDTVKHSAGGVVNTAKGAAESATGAAKGAVNTASGAAKGAVNTATETAKGAAGAVTGSAYYAEETGENGRLYVFGSASEHQAFKAGNAGELWVSAISAGPNGETVMFEVSKEEAEMPDRLTASFNKKYGLNL